MMQNRRRFGIGSLLLNSHVGTFYNCKYTTIMYNKLLFGQMSGCTKCGVTRLKFCTSEVYIGCTTPYLLRLMSKSRSAYISLLCLWCDVIIFGLRIFLRKYFDKLVQNLPSFDQIRVCSTKPYCTRLLSHNEELHQEAWNTESNGEGRQTPPSPGPSIYLSP